MAPHGLILSENEAIPSTMLFRLLLGLFEPILYTFLMQIRPQGSGPPKLASFLFSLLPVPSNMVPLGYCAPPGCFTPCPAWEVSHLGATINDVVEAFDCHIPETPYRG